MPDSLLLLALFAAAYAGFALLALSRARHWRAVVGAAALPRSRVLMLRTIGGALVILSLLLAITRDGPSSGSKVALHWWTVSGFRGDLLPGLGEPERGREAVLPVYHHIDGDADEDLRGDVEQLVDRRAGHRRGNPPAVAAGVAQQTQQCLPLLWESCIEGSCRGSGGGGHLSPA